MRKWTYLVASLLLVGATATFTGCIDTDEPVGISVLRGAKADLIKAKTAVELVQVDMQKALVANQLLLNEYQALTNKIREVELESAKIDLEIHKLDVELKKLVVERDKAYTEAYKKEMDDKIALHEAKIAEWVFEKAEWENAKLLAAEKFKASLILAQQSTADAQFHYEQALDAIAAAKLIVGDGELKVLEAAYWRLTCAKSILDMKWDFLQGAQAAADAALLGITDNEKLLLEDDLIKAQWKLESAQRKLAKATEAYEKDPVTTDWLAEFKELEKEIEDLKLANDQLDIDIKKIEITEEYKAAKALADKEKAAYDKAKLAYDNENTKDPVEHNLKAFNNEDVKNNAVVVTGLDVAKVLLALQADPVDVTGYTGGVFSYAKVDKYNYKSMIDENHAGYAINGALAKVKEVEGWLALIDKATEGIKLEDIAWSTRELANSKTASTNAANAYNTAYKAWETARDNFVNTTVPSMTNAKNTLDAAITAWNNLAPADKLKESNVDILGTALAAYYDAAARQDPPQQAVNSATNVSGVTKKFNEWMSESTSYFRTTIGTVSIAGQPAILTYTAGTITGAININATIISALQSLQAGGGLTLKQKFEAASIAAFGTAIYQFNPTSPRLTAPTAAEIATATENITAGTPAANYGALGTKIATAAEVTRLQNILDQADVYKALLAAITAQQTALKAEIAANTKLYVDGVAAAKLKADDAKKVSDAAAAALNALTKTEKDAKAKNSTLKTDLESLKALLETKYLDWMNGKATVEEWKHFLQEAVIDAQKAVTKAENAIARIEKDIELFAAGKYDAQYKLTRAEAELKLQTEEFGLAQIAYNEALEQLAKVLDMLSAKY